MSITSSCSATSLINRTLWCLPLGAAFLSSKGHFCVSLFSSRELRSIDMPNSEASSSASFFLAAALSGSRLFSICAACVAGSLSGVSTRSGIAAGGVLGMHGPFRASMRETDSYPGGMLLQHPWRRYLFSVLFVWNCFLYLHLGSRQLGLDLPTSEVPWSAVTL